MKPFSQGHGRPWPGPILPPNLKAHQAGGFDGGWLRALLLIALLVAGFLPVPAAAAETTWVKVITDAGSDATSGCAAPVCPGTDPQGDIVSVEMAQTDTDLLVRFTTTARTVPATPLDQGSHASFFRFTADEGQWEIWSRGTDGFQLYSIWDRDYGGIGQGYTCTCEELSGYLSVEAGSTAYNYVARVKKTLFSRDILAAEPLLVRAQFAELWADGAWPAYSPSYDRAPDVGASDLAVDISPSSGGLAPPPAWTDGEWTGYWLGRDTAAGDLVTAKDVTHFAFVQSRAITARPVGFYAGSFDGTKWLLSKVADTNLPADTNTVGWERTMVDMDADGGDVGLITFLDTAAAYGTLSFGHLVNGTWVLEPVASWPFLVPRDGAPQLLMSHGRTLIVARPADGGPMLLERRDDKWAVVHSFSGAHAVRIAVDAAGKVHAVTIENQTEFHDEWTIGTPERPYGGLHYANEAEAWLDHNLDEPMDPRDRDADASIAIAISRSGQPALAWTSADFLQNREGKSYFGTVATGILTRDPTPFFDGQQSPPRDLRLWFDQEGVAYILHGTYQPHLQARQVDAAVYDFPLPAAHSAHFRPGLDGTMIGLLDNSQKGAGLAFGPASVVPAAHHAAKPDAAPAPASDAQNATPPPPEPAKTAAPLRSQETPYPWAGMALLVAILFSRRWPRAP